MTPKEAEDALVHVRAMRLQLDELESRALTALLEEAYINLTRPKLRLVKK